jgi:DNA-binding response OmpR family regulator
MKKILFIEEDPARLIAYPTFLEKENFEVTPVSDGQLGYEKGRSEHFDLIILRYGLPSKNGMDICRDLRKDGITTPILFIADVLVEDGKFIKKEVDLEFGATDYIYDPFDASELLAKIKTLLGIVGFNLIDIHPI